MLSSRRMRGGTSSLPGARSGTGAHRCDCEGLEEYAVVKEGPRDSQGHLGLRAGEWVEVRSAAEILATLDEHFTLNELPFMPEMLQHCGKTFRVVKSAHKTCDTIESFAIRRMDNAVHLEQLRCGGEAHGGCQAGCLFFWKEAWLKRSAGPSAADVVSHVLEPGSAQNLNSERLAGLQSACSVRVGADQAPRYRCQATEMRRATRPVTRKGRFNPGLYLKDLTSGNVKPLEFLRFGALAAWNAFSRRWFGWRYPRLRGAAGASTPTGHLGLKTGDLVRVKSKEEIMMTLNSQLRNRGLSFDVEMVPHCGKGPYRVLRRVERIINEKTGEMMEMPNPCIVLDNVVCSGNYSMERMFCPRAIYPYFREIWLTPIDTTTRP